MSQLRIDYDGLNGSSKTNDATTPNSSRTFKVLSGSFSEDSLSRKTRQLRKVNPKFAAVIEGLVDDALREASGRKL